MTADKWKGLKVGDVVILQQRKIKQIGDVVILQQITYPFGGVLKVEVLDITQESICIKNLDSGNVMRWSKFLFADYRIIEMLDSAPQYTDEEKTNLMTPDD